jgi:hypothetical protein
LRFGFRNALFPSCFPSRCRLSPLFYEDDQIFIFPAPINCFRRALICRLPARLSSKSVPRHKARPFGEQNLKSSESWLGRYYSSVLPSRVPGKKRCGRRVGELRGGRTAPSLDHNPYSAQVLCARERRLCVRIALRCSAMRRKIGSGLGECVCHGEIDQSPRCVCIRVLDFLGKG